MSTTPIADARPPADAAAAAAHVCPPDHSHGENLTCYSSHRCRCTDCRARNAAHGFYRRHMIVAGREDVFDSLVPVRGVRRRVEALMTLGYSQTVIAARLGTHQCVVSAWLTRGAVRSSTHAAVAALYDELQDSPATASSGSERMSVNRTRALAARRGYARPIDWDDIDVDASPSIEPVAESDVVDEVAVVLAVEGQHVQLTREERHLALRQLHARGLGDGALARMLRVSDQTVYRDRRFLGLPANDLDTQARAAA